MSMTTTPPLDLSLDAVIDAARLEHNAGVHAWGDKGWLTDCIAEAIRRELRDTHWQNIIGVRHLYMERTTCDADWRDVVCVRLVTEDCAGAASVKYPWGYHIRVRRGELRAWARPLGTKRKSSAGRFVLAIDVDEILSSLREALAPHVLAATLAHGAARVRYLSARQELLEHFSEDQYRRAQLLSLNGGSGE